MNCSEFQDRVDELLDGLLPPEESGRFEAHVAECGLCQQERDDAERFRDLLGTQGHDALEAWTARQLTERLRADAARAEAKAAPAGSPAAGSTTAGSVAPAFVPRVLPRRRRGPLVMFAGTLAIAAALLAAVVLDPPGVAEPQLLAAGSDVRMIRGERALVSEGSEVVCERKLHLAVQDGTNGRIVSFYDGAATFASQAGRELWVKTERGAVSAKGGRFLLRVLPDKLELVVLDGDVTFTDRKQREHQVVAPGVLAATRGGVHTADIETTRDQDLHLRMAAFDLGAEKGTVAELKEQLALMRQSEPPISPYGMTPLETPPSPSPLTFDELPWQEFGRATRELLADFDGRASRNDPRRHRATATVLWHAEEIQNATGASNPLDGLLHPDVLKRIAPSFFRALAPKVSYARIKAADQAMQEAILRLEPAWSSIAVPGERAVARYALQRALIVAVRDNLGDEAAAEVASGIRGASPLMPVWMSRRHGPDTAGDLTAIYARHFHLADDQREVLYERAAQYVDELLADQERIAERLGPEGMKRAFFARWKRGPRDSGEELDASERVERELEKIDARLDLARPQVALELAIWDILRPEQQERWDHDHWFLRVVRPQSE